MAQNPDDPFPPFVRACELPRPRRLQHHRSAGHLPPVPLDFDGLPVAVQLVAAYGREDPCGWRPSSRKAAPWADRRPQPPGT